MHITMSCRTLGAASVLVILMALVWWGASPYQASAQTPNEPLDERTPLTVDLIERDHGYVHITWPSDPSAATYRVERSLRDILTSPFAGSHIIADGVTETSYSDYDTIANGRYMYNVVPIKPEGDELPPIRSYHVAKQFDFLYGVGSGENEVIIHVQSDPYQPLSDQNFSITAYDNQELQNGHQIVSNYVPTQDLTPVGFEVPNTQKGTILYFKVVMFHTMCPSCESLPAPFELDPIAVMVGAVPPSEPDTLEIVEANGISTLTWSVQDDNKQALGYEIFRLQLKPITPEPAVLLGSTIHQSFTIPAIEDDGVIHKYQVVPIGTDYVRAVNKKGTLINPPLTPPLCIDPDNAPQTREINFINLYHDIMGNAVLGDPNAPRTEVPRTFDMFPYTRSTSPCMPLDLEDFFMERYTYHKHAQDANCTGPPGFSCNVITETAPTGLADGLHFRRNIAESEILYDVRPAVYGFWKWRSTVFADNTLPPGEYGMVYRVCSIGRQFCSYWRDTGIHKIGITTKPFEGDPVVVPDIRTYLEGVMPF